MRSLTNVTNKVSHWDALLALADRLLDCIQSFNSSSDLARHRRTHSKDKPHVCEQCSKGFSRKAHLTRHYQVHNKAKKASKTVTSSSALPSPLPTASLPIITANSGQLGFSLPPVQPSIFDYNFDLDFLLDSYTPQPYTGNGTPSTSASV